LPHDEHACSVSLPTWSSVVGYEEGNPDITLALRCGYPRFVYHPYVLQLMDAVLEVHSSSSLNNHREGEEEDCLVLPTAAAAMRCRNFLRRALEKPDQYNRKYLRHGAPSDDDDNAMSEEAEDDDLAEEGEGATPSRIRAVAVCPGLAYAVLFPAETVAGMEAKAYWQHTGEVVSSRRAETALLALGRRVRRRVTCPNQPKVRSPSNCGGGDGGGGDADDPAAASKAAATATPVGDERENKAGWGGDASKSNSIGVHDALRDRIADWAGVPSRDYVALVPSGMASMYSCLRSARRYQMMMGKPSNGESSTDPGATTRDGAGGGTSIVFGFPYLDTLKLCSRSEFCPDGTEFFGRGDADDLDMLEKMLRQSRRKYCALFTEVPSNPLLHCPDLHKLRELADERDFCLVVDDTISNFLNVELLESGLADAVCSSLTKLVSGRGDVMGGSVVYNPNTPRGRWMQEDFLRHQEKNREHYRGGLFDSDAAALLRNSRDFVERNRRINGTAEGLADWLQNHPDVQRVYYPKHSPSAPLYRRVRTPGGGYGGLLSMLLHPHVCQRTFYDALDVAKGPSLGTDFTLVCPYTLLAHYHELDFALQYHVPPNLLRVAVGLEPLDDLTSKFQAAFDKSRLYPKVCTEKKRLSRRAATTSSATRPYSTSTRAFASVRDSPLQRH